MEIKDQSKGLYQTYMLVTMTFKCGKGGIPGADQLNTLMTAMGNMLRGLENAHTESWVLQDVDIDSFPPSKELRHPTVAVARLMGLVAAVRQWTGVIIRHYPIFAGLHRAAADLGEVQSRLMGFMKKLPELLDSEEIRDHCRECATCKKVIEEVREQKEMEEGRETPGGVGGMKN